MEIDETVCAVLVTYNRKELLIECLEALENQTRPLDAIYILDNASNDGTTFLLLEKGYIKEIPLRTIKKPWERSYKKDDLVIHYVRMHENTGGAGGFHEGVKRAFKKGYQWLWITDDDIEPERDCLIQLLNKKSLSKVLVPLRLRKNSDIDEWAIIKFNWTNPFRIDPKEIVFMDKFKNKEEIPDTVEIQGFSFEGPLISREIVEKIGYPRKDFFIQGDDTDYSLKISYVLKENILLVKDALITRKLENSNNNCWKMYYAVRNMNYLHRKYGTNMLVKIRPVLISIVAIIFNLAKFNQEKMHMWYYSIIDSQKEELPLRFKP